MTMLNQKKHPGLKISYTNRALSLIVHPIIVQHPCCFVVKIFFQGKSSRDSRLRWIHLPRQRDFGSGTSMRSRAQNTYTNNRHAPHLSSHAIHHYTIVTAHYLANNDSPIADTPSASRAILSTSDQGVLFSDTHARCEVRFSTEQIGKSFCPNGAYIYLRRLISISV